MASTTDDTQFWNKAARKYAAAPIKDTIGYERTIERTREILGATDTVLEVGCGTGTTALKLAPAVGRLIATDVSSEMIAIARGKAATAGCTNVDFAVAAAGDVPGPDAAYNAVLAFNLLHLVPDRPSTLSLLHRRLKPGGLFVSKTPCLSEMNPLIRYAIPIAQFVGKAPYVSCFSAAELEGEIEAAGFTIIERARHGSTRKDARIFLVAQKPTDKSPERG